MKVGVFTIASKNYIAYARTLMASVEMHHPEYRRFLCLADEVAGYFDPAAENFEVIQADQLGIDTFRDMTVRYDIMEFNTAVKPFMIDWLFENTDLDCVIYLDPDIQVFNRLDELEEAFQQGASVILTPHITRPVEDGKIPDDHSMLQAGVFNLGFIALRRCDEALYFTKWWGRRLKTQCVADFTQNLFTDQRWCDLAPCFLEQLLILKHPGYNVAYWNLDQRNVTQDQAGIWSCNGKKLAFFHFSGISADKRSSVSKHQNRFDWNDIEPLHKLFEGYSNALMYSGWTDCKSWPYAYSYSSDDFRLSPIVRQLYRKMVPLAIGDVDRKPIPQILAEICNSACNEIEKHSGVTISNLMLLIHRSRVDLQSAFNLNTVEGQYAFAHWFEQSAPREYDLPLPMINAQTAHPTSEGSVSSVNIFGAPANAAPRNEVTPMVTIDNLNNQAGIPQLVPGASITNLMHAIWWSRKDLQHAFDLASQEGQAAFLEWFRVSVEREYGYDPTQPHAPHSRFADSSPLTRLVENSLQLIDRGKRLLFTPGNPSPFSKRVQKLFTKETDNIGQRRTQHCGEPGANLIGYAHAELGMGEHVRMTASALNTTDLDYGVLNFDFGVSSRKQATLDHGEMIFTNKYRANVFHINADQMLSAYFTLGHDFFRNRYNIGFWAWELSRCPDAWLPIIEMVDEIWAPSRFIQTAFAERTKKPVTYMPLCVTVPKFDKRPRSYFNLPDERFLFLFAFDFLSYIERKNPFATVRAFKAAFPKGCENAGLVIKVMNGDPKTETWRKLIDEINGDDRVYVLNETMTRADILSLIDTCDSFVSLHRSEGFGRGPAEAMFLGKPVIATNYSGNIDFTLSDNSCLVNYELMPVPEGHYVFEEGQVWAEVDVDHAAWHMRSLVNDPAAAAAIGSRGSSFIKQKFNPEIVGRLYTNRIREVS